jgi:hypothetical protein
MNMLIKGEEFFLHLISNIQDLHMPSYYWFQEIKMYKVGVASNDIPFTPKLMKNWFKNWNRYTYYGNLINLYLFQKGE